jgi:hypothetical protein
MGTRQRPTAVITTTDGQGGMVAVQDVRFEGGEWPIQLKVEGEPKKLWATLLLAEIFKRQWSASSLDQLDPAECSGSQTVRTEVGAIEIVWSETKEGALQIQARMAGEMSPDTVREFLSAVAEQCRNPIFTSSDWRGVLYHTGRPWCGELWLDEKTRLGPPSQQFSENMFGASHVVVVDMSINAISPPDAQARAQLMLREVGVFLSVVLGTLFRESLPLKSSIVLKPGTEVAPEFMTVALGYQERGYPAGMPPRGTAPYMPMVKVNWSQLWPELSYANRMDRAVPEGIVDLWGILQTASPRVRRQFLEAGRQFQAALIVGGEGHPTTAASLMVAVCEALKPIGQARNKKGKASVDPCDVVGSLLHESVAKIMRDCRPHPDGMRDTHFHNAENHGGEFDLQRMHTTYRDISLEQAGR